jgi:hypothetical protein
VSWYLCQVPGKVAIEGTFENVRLLWLINQLCPDQFAGGEIFKPRQKILKLNAAIFHFGLAYLSNKLLCCLLDVGVSPVTPAFAV